MTATDDKVVRSLREMVAAAVAEPWEFSPADARRAARLRPAAVVAAHRAAMTLALMAAAVLIVVGLVIAGTFSASQPGGTAAHRGHEVVVEGVFRAVGGPGSCGPSQRHPNCYPGYLKLSGRIAFVRVITGGRNPPRFVVTITTRAVDGRWRVGVPPGTYKVSGFTTRVNGGANCPSPPERVVVLATESVIGPVTLACPIK